MKYNDHISIYLAKPAAARGFDHVAAEARLYELCYMLISMTACATTLLKIGRKLQAEVKQMILSASQAHRHALKLDMLRSPDWRYKVLKDLGGVETLLRLWKRLSEPRQSFKRQRKILSDAEIRHRAHVQRCAKACAHPNIYRDPFRVDQEGKFRLPPLPRRASNRPHQRKTAYYYDARPVNDFRGLKQPIMVWPDEFLVFMNWEETPQQASEIREVREISVSKRRFAFVDKWLAAILVDTAEGLSAPPRLKTKTARAPPFVGFK